MRTGLTGTFFNILNVMVGTGIVVLPNMMLQTGKTLGVFIFLLDAFLATVAIYVI
jgi:amino acid permease